MESAIPSRLQAQRTCPMTMKTRWTPPYPSFSARFAEAADEVTMIIFGIQFAPDQGPDRDLRTQANDRCREFLDRLEDEEWIGFRDRGRFIDSEGLENQMIVAYGLSTRQGSASGPDAAALEALSSEWLGIGRDLPEFGLFVEVACSGVDRLETLYSSDHVQGVANIAESLSGEVQEHGYWGSARDRLPAAQTDELIGAGGRSEREGDVTVVRDIDNLCLIRSGQDWSSTMGAERAMYLEEVEPTLRDGMDFLTTQGSEVGCLANRYVRAVDDEGEDIDQSYGMSWWLSMADLDRWAKDHPTHKAIFGVAMHYLGEHGGSGNLKLTHEVFVLGRAQGVFRYRGCHLRTGLLALAAGT